MTYRAINAKIRLKVALLLRKIVYSETLRFVTNKIETALKSIECLRMKYEESHEVLADIVLTLMQSDDPVRRECRKDTNLKTFLESRKKELEKEDKEMYEDVIDMYSKIQKLLWLYFLLGDIEFILFFTPLPDGKIGFGLFLDLAHSIYLILPILIDFHHV